MKWLIGLMAMLSFNTFASDICLDWGSASSYNCSGYQYETLPVYFLDRHGVEQKFFAKKITRKSDGAFLHVDYEFHVKCTVNCSQSESARDQYLEDWKYALQNQATYNYEIISSCTRLTCGNEEPLSVGEISDSDVGIYAGTKNKMDLDSAESLTTTVNNIMNTTNTAFQLRKELQQQNASPSHPVRFLLVTGQSQFDDPKICEVQPDGVCQELKGDIRDYGNEFTAEFTSLKDRKQVDSVLDILEKYLRDRPLRCTSYTSCWTHKDGTRACSASFTCFR